MSWEGPIIFVWYRTNWFSVIRYSLHNLNSSTHRKPVNYHIVASSRFVCKWLTNHRQETTLYKIHNPILTLFVKLTCVCNIHNKYSLNQTAVSVFLFIHITNHKMYFFNSINERPIPQMHMKEFCFYIRQILNILYKHCRKGSMIYFLFSQELFPDMQHM